MPNDMPPIGHNQPPEMQDVVSQEILSSEEYANYKAAIARLNAEKAALPDEVDNDTVAADFGEVIQKCVATRSSIEAQRDAKGRPYLLTKRAIDGIYKNLDADVLTIENALRKPTTAYIQRKAAEERARREAEARKKLEEERRTREAAEKAKRDSASKIADAVVATAEADKAIRAAAAPTADLARVRGQKALVGGREVVTISVDRNTVDLNMLRPYLDQDALVKAARAAIKALGKDDAITGVTVSKTTEAFVR